MSNPMPAAPMPESSENEGECTCPNCGAKLTIQASDQEEQAEPAHSESGNEAAMKKVAAYTGE